MHGANILRQGIVCRIGNWTCVNFWNDCWVQCGVLHSFATNPPDINKNDSVQDFMQGRSWNGDMHKACLPPHIVSSILHPTPLSLWGVMTIK